MNTPGSARGKVARCASTVVRVHAAISRSSGTREARRIYDLTFFGLVTICDKKLPSLYYAAVRLEMCEINS